MCIWANYGQEDTKSTKTRLQLLRNQRAKAGSRVLCLLPSHITTKEVDKQPMPPLDPPIPSPLVRHPLANAPSASKQAREACLFSFPLLQQGPQ